MSYDYDEKIIPLGDFTKDGGTMVSFKLLADEITRIAMNRISPDGHPCIWFSELCTILGCPQPVFDRMIYFDMDPCMIRTAMLDFEKRHEASIELISENLFTVITKEGVLYTMKRDDNKWTIIFSKFSKSEGHITISKDFMNEIDTLCKLVDIYSK